jgi:hypothetical protein
MLSSIPVPISAPVPVDRARRAPGARRPLAPRTDSRAATRAALVADFLAIVALDPTVEGLRAPAGPARFLVGDDTVEHAADFELLREGEAPLLVDVVEDAALRDHPLGAALVIADEVAAEDGRRLRVETAWTLRAEPRMTTVRLAMACRRTFVSAGDRVRILHHLDECGTGRLVDCAAAATQASDGVAAVLALACAGLVAVDVRCPIVPEMPVRRRRLPAIDPFGF